MGTQHTKHFTSSVMSGKEKELSVSARKLAATLWESNDMPESRMKKDSNADKVMRSKKKGMRKQKAANSLELCLSDKSYSPVCESEVSLYHLYSLHS